MAFVRTKEVPKDSDNWYRYLVEGEWEDGQSRQKVIKYLGVADGKDDTHVSKDELPEEYHSDFDLGTENKDIHSEIEAKSEEFDEKLEGHEMAIVDDFEDEKVDALGDAWENDLTKYQRKSIDKVVLHDEEHDGGGELGKTGANYTSYAITGKKLHIYNVNEKEPRRLRQLLKHEAAHDTFDRLLMAAHEDGGEYEAVVQDLYNAQKEEGGYSSQAKQYHMEFEMEAGSPRYKKYLRRAMNEDLAKYYELDAPANMEEQTPEIRAALDKISELEEKGELNYSKKYYTGETAEGGVPPLPDDVN